MSKLHWTVVPGLLAAGWLALVAATLVTLSDVPAAFPAAAVEAATAAPRPSAVDCDAVALNGRYSSSASQRSASSSNVEK